MLSEGGGGKVNKTYYATIRRSSTTGVNFFKNIYLYNYNSIGLKKI